MPQDESEVDFHKYPSSSLPDLVSTCSAQDVPPSPGDGKENMEPDVEDVRASSLSLPTQDSVRMPDMLSATLSVFHLMQPSFTPFDCPSMLCCVYVLLPFFPLCL